MKQMSTGVMEEILATLKRIEANTAGATRVVSESPSPAAASTDKPAARGRGRPAGSTKAAETPAPKVESASDVGGDDDSSFLDGEPEAKPTKDEVRAALVAYNKKVNSEQKTRELLKKAGGVDNLSALPEDKFAAVIKAANAA
jgi:hypothetical protein